MIENRKEVSDVVLEKKPKDRERSAAMRACHQIIGDGIRRLYSAVLAEPVPERFTGVLREVHS